MPLRPVSPTVVCGMILICEAMMMAAAPAQNAVSDGFSRNAAGTRSLQAGTTEKSLLATVIPLEYADVSAPRDGMIDQLPVKLGQTIGQSGVVATLKKEEIIRRVRKAEAERDAAEARATNDFLIKSIEVELGGQQRRLNRTLALQNNKRTAAYVPVTRSEIEQLQATVEKLTMDAGSQRQQQREAEAQFAAAQREVDLIAFELQRSKASSPIDGVVSEIHRHRGEFTRAGEKIATVMRADRMQLQLEIRIAGRRDRLNGSAESLPSLADLIGRSVVAEIDAFGGGADPMTVEGKIDRIAPEIMSGPSVRAYVEFDNERIQANASAETMWRSLPGQLATVTLLTP